MKICKKCIQPDTRPKIYFNEDGICGACIWEEEKKKIDWVAREKQLQKIADWAKETTKSNYDCVIGVSGGKDSTFQALTARDRLGLKCLLVNGEPDGITEIGRSNIENLKNLGFDVISVRPNPKIMPKLSKYDFYKYLNPWKVHEFPLWSPTYIIAYQFDIPLIIQGENAALTLGVSGGGQSEGYDALEINQGNTMGGGWKEYLIEGITEKDLYFFHYDKEKLQKKGIRGVWLQYFLKEWDYKNNFEFSRKYGFKWRNGDFDPNSIGTYIPFAQLDSDQIQVAQFLKYIKFGFGQCMDYACYDIRAGRISRDEAIDLVKKHDGKISDYYIKVFCDYVSIEIEEFWNVVNRSRGPIWIKKDNEWYNTYWDYLKRQ